MLPHSTSKLTSQIEYLISSIQDRIDSQSRSYQMDKLSARFNVLKNDYLIAKSQLSSHEEEEEAANYNDESTPLVDGTNADQLSYTTPQQQLRVQKQIQKQSQSQEQEVSANELAYHENLVQDHSQAISNIQQGVQDINQIYKTLDNIVIQQGEQVSSIENNILGYAQDTHLAMGELNKADEYQKKKSKWCFMIALILLLLVVIIFILVI